MMSPGLVARAARHVLGRRDDGHEVDRERRARRSPRSPRARRRRPDMSIFISCIPAAGLIEMPPVSKVTRLADEPEPPRRSRRRRSAARSAAAPRREPARDGDEAAHPALGDLVAPEDLDRDGSWAAAISRARSARRSGSSTFGGQVLELAGAVRGLGGDPARPRRRRPPRRRRRPATSRSSAGRSGSSGSLALVAVEAVGGEDVPSTSAAAASSRRVRRLAGHGPGERARLVAARPASSPARRRPGARSASNSSRLPRPTTSSRRAPSGRSIVGFLKAGPDVAGARDRRASGVGQLVALEQADQRVDVGGDLAPARL